MAKAKIESKVQTWAVNVSKNKVAIIDGNLVIESGYWVELHDSEINHPEVFSAKRKGWIKFTNTEPKEPLYPPREPIRAIDATKGLSAALGGQTTPPPKRGQRDTGVTSVALGHRPFVEDNVAETKLTEKKVIVKKPKAKKAKAITAAS